jgi:adenine phosphoribosyltransferase
VYPPRNITATRAAYAAAMQTLTAAEHVQNLTRTVHDFPTPGIRFLDLTPVLADPAALRSVAAALVAPFAGEFDVVAGVEARGFAFAAAAAAASGHGLLLIRKAGKLPGERLAESYALEYGEATLEVHVDQLPASTRVLLVDDVLATGGTLGASARLIERAGWLVAGVSVVLELPGLGGRSALGRDVTAIARS